MIENARKKYNLTQKELAKRCNITQGHLSKLENFKHGDSLPNLALIMLIAKELNLSPHKLSSWFIDKELDSKFEFSTELCITGGKFLENSNLFKKIKSRRRV